MRRSSVMIGVLSGATSCGLLEADSRRIVGLIADPPSATIQAPDTVRLREIFRATVNTFGSSSCTTPDGVELTQGSSEARVVPYDRVPVGKDVVCTADLAAIPHSVELQFTEAGAATIIADGMVDRGPGQRVRGSVTKAVVVMQHGH
jgi:hypothetical protein